MAITIHEIELIGAARLASLARAVAQRAKVQGSIRAMEARRAKIDGTIRNLLGEPKARAVGKRTTPPSAQAPKPISHYMKEILDRAKKPLVIAEIRKRIQAAGYRSNGKDVAKTVRGSILSAVRYNPEVFRKIGRGLISLVGGVPSTGQRKRKALPRQGRRTVAAWVHGVLAKNGGAVAVRDLVGKLQAAGYKGSKHIEPAIYNVMKRKPEIFRRAGPGKIALVRPPEKVPAKA